MATGLDDEVKRLERTRHATFTFTGVIAARTPEDAQKTHDAIKKICAVIIEAYRVANDAKKSREEKVDAIVAVTTLLPQLEWLVQFTKIESDFCRFDELKTKMTEIANMVASQVQMLKADFQSLRSQIEAFPDVFDVMLAVLEQMTEFLKQGHATEVCRVIDSGKHARGEANNLLNLEVKANLVAQAKLTNDRCQEFWKATEQLVTIQDEVNNAIRARIDNVDVLLRTALPELILRTKDSVLNPGNGELKELQKQAHADLIACFDEIAKILERVKAKYTNSFDEDAIKVNADLDGLEIAVGDVFKNLAKLKGAAAGDMDDEERRQAADGLSGLTKAALSEMNRNNLSPEDKQKLIAMVKQARDGNSADFFQASDAIAQLVEKAKLSGPARPAIPQISEAVTIEPEGPRDMLEAAKQMCAALKKLNVTLDA